MEAAIANAKDAKKAWLEAALEEGIEIKIVKKLLCKNKIYGIIV